MLQHTGKIIETQRLILGQFIEEDADDMFNNWIGDNDTCK